MTTNSTAVDLPNLDRLEELSRGEQPEPEPSAPSDTETRARCLLPLLSISGVTTASQLSAKNLERQKTMKDQTPPLPKSGDWHPNESLPDVIRPEPERPEPDVGERDGRHPTPPVAGPVRQKNARRGKGNSWEQ